MILTKAGVYVKNAQANGNGGASGGGTRVSKQAAQDALVAAINDKGLDVDEDIISNFGIEVFLMLKTSNSRSVNN